ncbi:Oxaloacetate decarboxylase [compost metagenome]
MEDTQLPAAFGGPAFSLITIEEGIGKLRAAQRARQDVELALIARTHAGAQPLSEVIERTSAYQDAGADGICLVGVQDFEHLEAIADGLRIPLMLVTYGNVALRDQQRLSQLGVRIVVDGHAACFAAIKATYDSLREQRGIAEKNSLAPSDLCLRYASPNEYLAWAKEFMGVTG